MYRAIEDGDKIKYAFLKDNELDFVTMAITDDEVPQVLDFIKHHIDYEHLFDSIMSKKLETFYESLGWEIKLKLQPDEEDEGEMIDSDN